MICCHLLKPCDTWLFLLLATDLVDSNDSLYGGDSKFLAENNKLCETVMAQILEHLKTLAKDEMSPDGPLLTSSCRKNLLSLATPPPHTREDFGSSVPRGFPPSSPPSCLPSHPVSS
ncbi:Hypothetical predicted protein [Marmota monax]|uniref:VPS35 endosomal protein-sorting factor-like n=1 Tax=Marmota monax TaxID=9995 RepID=A0A5E4A534_MARMO|nr:hypothetical protein GHT09_002548 [Marmota monax]VTJ52026.1 Hypothetical predicted protein [Marmota monax]